MKRFLTITAILIAACMNLDAASYGIKVNGRTVKSESFCDISYVCLEGNGSRSVTISGNVSACEVSPHRKKVKVSVSKGAAKFTLPHEGWWVARINDTDRIFFFIDQKSKAPQQNIIKASDYPSVQSAVDAASRAGKTLVFTEGTYTTGTVRIGSNIDIYLDKGAVIKASERREDFPTDDGRLEADKVNHPESYSDNGEVMTFSRLLLIEGNNVSIRGRGVIDGSGSTLRAQGKPANLIRIRNSENVLIEGVILRNPAAWNTHILNSEDVTIRDVKILNDPLVPNTDGIDPDSSTDVTISHCFAYCSDDNIAVKSTNNSGLLRNVSDILVRDCVFLTRKSSLKIGTETKAAAMNDIRFINNDLVECDRAFVIYCNDGAAISDILFEGNRVERNWPDSQRKIVHFKISKRNGIGSISNVTLRNCVAERPFPKQSEITGYDEEHMIENVTFENCSGVGKEMKTKNASRIKTK